MEPSTSVIYSRAHAAPYISTYMLVLGVLFVLANGADKSHRYQMYVYRNRQAYIS